MKILTLVFSIGPGGTERAAVNYAVAYRQFGHDSRVLVAGEGHDRKDELEEAGVETVLATRCSHPIGEILQQLHNWAPDIIHLHNYSDAYLPYLEKIRAAHTRVVETNVFSRPHFEKGYRMVDLSLQLSNWGLWKYSRWMRGAAWCPRQAVIPYIMLGERFTAPYADAIRAFRQSHGIPDDAFLAGRLGQPHPSKWDIRLFDIAEQVIRNDNKTWFFLVGLPASMQQELLNRSPLVRSRMVLLDAIRGDERLSLYYHSLQCMVHLSAIGESFGYVLAEALWCRVPVITLLTPFRDNAQYEVVGRGGICCTSIQECIAAITQLSTDPSLLDTYRKQLPALVTNRFSPAAVIPRMLKLYEGLLNGEPAEAQDPSQLVQEVCRLYGWKGSFLYFLLKLYNSHWVIRFLQMIKKRRS